MALRIENRLVDVWTPVHYGAGFTLGLLGLKRVSAFWWILGYELFENIVLREAGKKVFNGVEMPLNIFSDVVFGQAGYETARFFINKKVKP